MSEKPKRYRNWQFTLNNYVKEDMEMFMDPTQIECKYVQFGEEEAPTTGTPHLQGMIIFENAKTRSAVKKIIGRNEIHLEPVLDVIALMDYNAKGDYVQERGERPKDQSEKGELERLRWDLILEHTKKGEFEKIDSKTQIIQARNLEFVYQKELKKQKLPDTEEKMLWYFGTTGTGKSRKARTEYPDAYLKSCNKWWDHYNKEDTVIIEDFDKKHEMLIHYLKIWSDRYPFPCEVKNGTLGKIRPKLIIVTSNYSPADIWTDKNDLDPILRRFNCYEFKKNCEPKLVKPKPLSFAIEN